MSASQDVRYASVDDVLRAALDTKPSEVQDPVREQARQRAASATQKWVKRTGRPFHPVRVGDPDDPRTWEVYDVQDATSWHPATILLDNHNPLPLDSDEGDAIEVRTGRDSWEDVTSEEGETWTLDSRRKRLRVFQRRLAVTPYSDPNTRFCRLTYRYGSLDEETTVTDDGLVEGVPSDVVEAVAAKAAMRLALDDDAGTGVPDNGQLVGQTTIYDDLESTWTETTAHYSGFSSL